MFEFEEHHRMVEKTIRAFAEKEIAPHLEAMTENIDQAASEGTSIKPDGIKSYPFALTEQ